MRGFLLAVTTAMCLSASASDVNELMRDIGDTMLRMLPALHEEEPDRTLLLENLTRLEYLFNEAGPHLEARPAGAQVTYELIERRLDDAVALGERRNIQLLRRSIAETFELCGACHSQDGVTRPAFGVSKIRALDEFLAAEFSYLTRDYGSSVTSVKNYFSQGERTADRDQVMLERALSIGAEVMADPAFASELLSSLLPELTGNSHEQAQDWIRVLDRLVEEDDALRSPLAQRSIRALDRFIDREYLGIASALNVNEQEAYWVVIRGALARMLDRNPNSKDVPRLLYWLAVSDRALYYRYYDALSTAYLERCVESYPKHPYARRCVEEYEFLVLINFSGSGGVRVPPEVQERLNALRERANGS